MDGYTGARESLIATIEADPFEALEGLREAGTRKAKAEAVASHLEHMRKVVLARIAGEIAQAHSGAKLSEAKVERMALANPQYEAHLRGLAAAVEEREDANAEFWARKSELEWMDRTAMMAMSLAKLQK